MEGGAVLGSGDMTRQKKSLKCPRKVELEGYLGQMMEGLVGRIQREILVAQGTPETWIPRGIILYHIHQFINGNVFGCDRS